MPDPNPQSNRRSNPVERRVFGRRSTMKPARLVCADREPLPAVVIDISESGARIRVDCGNDVPKQFDLEIFEDGVSIGCEVVHLGANYVGVKFIRLSRRIRSVSTAEVARLKVLVEAATLNGHDRALPESLRREPQRRDGDK